MGCEWVENEFKVEKLGKFNYYNKVEWLKKQNTNCWMIESPLKFETLSF